MKLQVFLAVATVVALSAQGSVGFAGLGRRGRPGGPGGPGRFRPSPEERACVDLLMPAEEREQLKETIKTCITEDYDAILKTIYPDGLPPGTNPIEALEENGYSEEALGLRTCIAQAMGFVDESGSLDEEKIISTIQEAAAGTPQQENIELGLESCPTDGFSIFETCEFIKCVIAYCASGAAP